MKFCQKMLKVVDYNRVQFDVDPGEASWLISAACATKESRNMGLILALDTVPRGTAIWVRYFLF